MTALTLKTALTLTFAAAFAFATTGCFEEKSNEGTGFVVTSDDDNQLFQQKSINNFGLKKTKRIVLTYDDGPTRGVTDGLLDLLRRYNIKATFFIQAKNVKGKTDLLERMRDEGHILANHSYSHQDLSTNLYYKSLDSLLHQVRDADRVIAPYMNPVHTKYFRAPFGAWTASHAAKLNNTGNLSAYIGPVFWDIGGAMSPTRRSVGIDEIQTAADWSCWHSSKKKNIKSIPVEICAMGYYREITAKGGGVVLMHDLDKRTVEMSAMLIPQLIEDGYEFINLDELRSLEQYM